MRGWDVLTVRDKSVVTAWDVLTVTNPGTMSCLSVYVCLVELSGQLTPALLYKFSYLWTHL